MIKDIIEQNAQVSPNAEELAILHRYFPSCFTNEGKFDLDLFETRIKDSVETTKEGYALNWLGKDYARMIASMDTTTVIVPDEEHNAKPENKNSENIYISGDNLDALSHLLKSYAGRIKCIYIDPPYNTGSDDFAYNDKFSFTKEDLVAKLSISEEQASKILDLTKRGSASHSAWLMFMAPRLQLAKDLLSEDGVIFISIDDNEQANLKLLCDSVLGEENLLSQIIVQSNKRGQTYKQLAKTHEYLLVYARSERSVVNELKKELGTNIKKDSISEFSERELRNRNPKYGRFNRPNLFYPIYVNPNLIDENGYSPVSLERTIEYSIEVLPFNSEQEESCWRWGKEKFKKNISEDSLYSNVVGRVKSTGEYGVYEKYRKKTYKAKTIWYDDLVLLDEDDDDEVWDETGVITEQGSSELKRYGMEDAFDFPKPSYLIKKVLSIGSDETDICLDFFSGSATTAEAVMSLNAIHGHRKYILVQLPEDIDVKYEKASSSDKPKLKKIIDFLDSVQRPHALDEVGQERIVRAARRIQIENGAEIDYGFRHYTLKDIPQNTLDQMESFSPDAIVDDFNLKDRFGVPTILTTWLVRDGYGFNAPVEPIKLDSYTVYSCGQHMYFIDEGLSESDIIALVDLFNRTPSSVPSTLVLFGYSFLYHNLELVKKNLRSVKIGEDTRKLNIDVRY